MSASQIANHRHVGNYTDSDRDRCARILLDDADAADQLGRLDRMLGYL